MEPQPVTVVGLTMSGIVAVVRKRANVTVPELGLN